MTAESLGMLEVRKTLLKHLWQQWGSSEWPVNLTLMTTDQLQTVETCLTLSGVTAAIELAKAMLGEP